MGGFHLRLWVRLEPPFKSTVKCAPMSTVPHAAFSQVDRWEASLETPVSPPLGEVKEAGETFNYPPVAEGQARVWLDLRRSRQPLASQGGDREGPPASTAPSHTWACHLLELPC